jgi:signal transduction histidine kinase
MSPPLDLLKRLSCTLPIRRAVLLTLCATLAASSAAEEAPPKLMSVAEFNQSAGRTPWTNARFRLEGSIRSISRDRRLLALEDGSGCVLLDCHGIPENAAAHQGISIESKGCTVIPDRFALRIDPSALAIEISGNQPMVEQSGSCFLEEGLQPFRLDWFNGGGDKGLKLEYEGENLPREPVPESSFSHAGASGEPLPGLRYQAFVQDTWASANDIAKLTPVAEGITSGLQLDILPRSENAGLSFQGLLRVPTTGRYTFHLSSDDGSHLGVGRSLVSCTLLPTSPVISPAVAWTNAIPLGKTQWVKASGTVNGASRQDGRLELEVSGENLSYNIAVLDPGSLQPSALLGRQLYLEGLGSAGGVIVVAESDLELQEPSDLITQAAQVRRLKPEEARKPYRVRIRGVVTMVNMRILVIQDATGGVFTWYRMPSSGTLPCPGELWEVDGITDPGNFSPMITDAEIRYLGRAPMPKPMRPTWDEIATGSVDSELVELEGVVVSASTSQIQLLVRDGMIEIQDDATYPVPTRWLKPEELAALPGSVVRIRGVFKATWDNAGRAKTGTCLLGNALMSVDEPAPVDPFAAPAIAISDLLLFTSQTAAFKRVRVAGEILYSRPPMYILSDGERGFRVWSNNAPEFAAGDHVEVAGFPRLGAITPKLVEAAIRKAGTAALPEPQVVAADSLPDVRLDATRVKIEATLLNDHLREDERLLEVVAGSRRFIARMDLPGNEIKPIQPGSILQLTGTYSAGLTGSPATTADDFELLINAPADLVILRRGPWWTPAHTITAIGLLSGGILVAGIWVHLLRRTVGLRTKELAKEIEERQIAERRREVEQERTRVAHDLHDELGAALTEVGMLASMVKSPIVPEHKKEDYLGRLGEVSHGLVTALDEVVWAVNPRYDSVAGLAEYFSLYAQRFLELPGIRCRPRISESVALHPLGSHQRHDIFLAFKEALNNIVRHSQATEVMLSIDVNGDGLKIELSDNGRGFDPATSHPSGSDGLASLTERMTRLGGRCDIASMPGKGTTIKFSLPLERIES